MHLKGGRPFKEYGQNGLKATNWHSQFSVREQLFTWEEFFMARTILIVILILILLGSLPAWPYSAGWGYYPSGGLGLILIIMIILIVLDKI
jgi:hypothetical protein